MASSCGGCKSNLKYDNCMGCSQCRDTYCLHCLYITESHFISLSQDYKRQWFCPKCQCSKPKKDNSCTPIKSHENVNDNQTKNHSTVTTRSNKQKVKSINTLPLNSNLDVSSLLSEIQQLRLEIGQVRQEIKDQTKAFSKSLEDRLDEYSKIFEAKDSEILSLKSTVDELQQKIAEQEQRSLKNEIELIGMPEEDNENLTHLTLLTAQKVGVELKESDIDEVVRIGPKRANVLATATTVNKPRPIIVKLQRRMKKDELLKAAKVRRNLTTENITSKPPQKLYINERLTKANRNLFRDARLQAQKHGFRFCWVRNGAIYIRKAENTPGFQIHSHTDLELKIMDCKFPNINHANINAK
ncbi:hypothetical protein O3G_MSEX013066 [Manduca sexta]|uniref:FP protein C-terminal domain-containing protein n=1 Tax=Manduca sexta TaxID=7130 RepID=A0A922CWH9_MANSE|nr:hypothetical protein O3G_MSEX013066 [Manduca sexta]